MSDFLTQVKIPAWQKEAVLVLCSGDEVLAVLQQRISENFKKDFEEVAIILSPVTPNTPPKIGDSLKDPLAMYLSDAYTVGFSLGQLPTLTAPQGTATGLQITAAKNNEELVLQFANFLKELI